MAEWETTKIKYNGVYWNGLTYSPQDLCDENEGTLVLRSSNIKDGQMTYYDNVYVKCPIESKALIKKNDILICSRNGSKELIGKNAIYTKDEKMAFGAFMMIYRCKNPRYMYYVLNSDIFKENIGLFSTSTVNQLTGSIFGNIKFPLPPEIIQKQIVQFLDSKCATIASLKNDIEKQIETLEQYKKSVITEAVTKGINPNVKMRDSGIEWIGEIPEHWEIEKGKYVLEYLEKPVKSTDGVITCFRDGEVTLRSNRREDGFTISEKEIGYQGIDVGDLVVHGMDGFAGSIGISDSRGKASPVLNVLDSKQNKKYLMYYLRSMAYGDVFLALATGIRVRSCDLRWNKLAELPYPIPPIEEQNKIVEYIDSTLNKTNNIISTKKQQLEKLEEYKKSLIFEYVTGKREV